MVFKTMKDGELGRQSLTAVHGVLGKIEESPNKSKEVVNQTEACFAEYKSLLVSKVVPSV